MKLYKKTLLIISTVLVGLIIVIYVTSQILLMDSFTSMEERYTQKNVERALEALQDDVKKLDSTAGDWSEWDDTYAFIEDTNENYINSNLVNETFTTLKINLILFINSSGGMVYGKAFDIENIKEMTIPAILKEKISLNDPLIQHRTNAGIIMTSEGPMLIASRSILTSESKGPAKGTLVMGRYLSAKEIERIAGITHLSLSIHRFDEPQLPSDFQSARSSLSIEKPFFIQPFGNDSVAGYTLLRDIYGSPALVLRMDMQRDIYDQGKATMDYFIGSLLVIGLFFGVMSVVLFERSILSRTAVLSDSVSRIGKSGSLSERVNISGDDELQKLAQDINGMLGSLEKSQKELNKSEEKNRALVNAVPDIMLQLDKDGTILNYKATKNGHRFDISDNYSGKNVYELMPAELAKQMAFYLDRAIQTGSVQIFEFEIFRNGKKYEYEARYVASGKDEVLSIMRDITERKQAEEKVTQLLDELKRSNIELEQFAYVASHDLQEPLRVVASYVQLLERRYKGRLDSDADDFIAFAVDGAKRMQNMINDLLQYSRVTTRGKPLEPTDCNAVLGSVLSNIKISVDESSAIITHDSLPTVLADASQIERVLQNLISNAIKFRSEEKPHIHIGVEQKQNEWLFSVRDNGIGFDMKQAERLFTMFQRLHGERYSGTGMGLAICKKIVERHGGRIWVESEVDKGSTFYFTIPIRKI